MLLRLEAFWVWLVPILIIPSWSDAYVIYSDASKGGLGCVLMQYGKVVAFVFR